MTILDDNNLAYLLSLGFELDLCRQALSQNSTMENATEWILNPSRAPVLNLTQTSSIPKKAETNDMDLSVPYSSGSHLKFKSHENDLRDKAYEESRRAQQKKFEQIANELRKDKIMEREAKKRALLEIKNDHEKRKCKGGPSKASSLPVNKTLTERERMQIELKKKKKLEQEQKQRVLEDIQNDKNDKKDKRSKLSSTSFTTTLSTPQKANAIEAFIQFKLSDASTIRQKFPLTARVKDLLEFIFEKELVLHNAITINNISLVCVFPRRVFTLDDGALDMKEANFLPNVSLNVLLAPTSPPEVTQEDTIDNTDEHNMDGIAESDSDDESNSMIDTYIPAFNSLLPPLIARHRRSYGPETSGGHQLTDLSPPVEEIAETTETVHVEENAADLDRRENMALAAEQRIAGLLTQHTSSANRYLKSLSCISADIAESLLKYLIKNGKLNVTTLRKLADHCYLQNVIFDSYSYCTDSLIEDLSKSNSSASITKLSLRGCELITDGAIRSLEGLKNLTYLDLNNCKVTDKGLKSLEKLPYLSYLNLSKTKITNTGIASMVGNAKFKPELQMLLLDGCTRVKSCGILIPIVNEFINLIQLSFAYTTPGSILEDQQLTNKNIRLEQLDINHTCFNDQDLIGTISQFKSLVELKLGGCEELTTRGLSFLPRELRNLRHIQFPNREHELDSVLHRYKDLPIEYLDLSGFLNITDEGAENIAFMKHLRYLNLNGTKVTDKGISQFENLIELDTLYLDRTLLTDVGLRKLQGLSKLETLSLSRTKITNDGLCMLGDFEQTSFARNLRTLNLAQCTLVTDKGVRGIAGMLNLTNLNLDHTGVGKSCLKYLKDLKNLNLVRLQGIEKEEDDTMDNE
ncbi:uncharacterized protein EV154DRAFT_571777 [Mucor mucedo]|uniref:uncharacterized protein n=1 Tax=Mucor mucedo TaxID=29922 RepID=UPI00221F5756|nr:uncharacterized protein EV154DRAFT_571777 [Mucor mucedo]KAI7867073.1 hypothetical protein EV154DRAFT_571777 [Mucor mucedo]